MSHRSHTFEPEVNSVPVVRRFVRGVLSELGAEAVVATVSLLVSELATNAVLHARTAFTVQVRCEAGTVRVSVVDRSRTQARVRSYGTEATTGRGLRLLDSMATHWGVDPCDNGKEIWFEVAADGRDDDAELECWTDEADIESLLTQFDDDADAVVRVLVDARGIVAARSRCAA